MSPDPMVQRPRDATAVAALVRDAAAGGRALRIRGAGTWLDAGRTVRAAHSLALDGMKGVIAYEPGDLTISVASGTTLAELDAITLEHRQWCPLLPWGDDTGTVGATVSTATSGPFADSLGRPRDLVLGLECVDGTGRVIAAGGRVVKNVAGFDLSRAITGSWGTLAVITALHLRLRARPPVDETWALAGVRATAEAIDAFRRGPLAPLACVPLSAEDAAALGAGEAHWLVRLGGNAAFVAASRDQLRSLGELRPLDASAWTAMRRRAAPPARAEQWRWDPLSQRLKARFDPARILNPGLLGEPA